MRPSNLLYPLAWRWEKFCAARARTDMGNREEPLYPLSSHIPVLAGLAVLFIYMLFQRND